MRGKGIRMTGMRRIRMFQFIEFRQGYKEKIKKLIKTNLGVKWPSNYSIKFPTVSFKPLYAKNDKDIFVFLKNGLSSCVGAVQYSCESGMWPGSHKFIYTLYKSEVGNVKNGRVRIKS